MQADLVTKCSVGSLMPPCKAYAFQDPERGINGDAIWLETGRDALWQSHHRGEAPVPLRAGDVRRTREYSGILRDTRTIMRTLTSPVSSQS
jgi:hypothetical protein